MALDTQIRTELERRGVANVKELLTHADPGPNAPVAVKLADPARSDAEDWLREKEREAEAFLKLGLQYYIAARSAVLAHLRPTCGNLYHHAIEMLLKAGLTRQHSLDDLHDNFGHHLPRIWDAYKLQFGATNLDRFNRTIQVIHQFEKIRYPDNMLKHGARIVIQWGSAFNSSSCPRSARSLYQLDVVDIDHFVVQSFETAGYDPIAFASYIGSFPRAREIIMLKNPVAARLLGSSKPEAEEI